jgi:methylisocitrate lyase
VANAKLRQTLEAGGIVVAPSAFDAITARLFRHLGFNGLSVPGSGTGTVLGVSQPLTTLTQMAVVGETVVKGVRDELPVILDAGAGFGDPVHVMHTVEVLEDAGVTAVHIEDQFYPKRVTYQRGLEHLVPIEEYQQRIEYALKGRRSKNFLIIARNDEYRDAVGGTREASVKRAHAALEVGADVIMPQGCKTVEDLRYFRKQIKDVPLCTTPRAGSYEVPELRDAGWQIVIHPWITLRAALMSVYREFKQVKETGYSIPVAKGEAQQFSALMDTLLGIDEKVGVEAATTEKGSTARH